MRICGVIASLGSGGAERVMVELCAGWRDRGHTVTLLTLSDGTDDFYAVPAGVARHALSLASVSTSSWDALRNNLSRLQAMRVALTRARPDVIVSFTDRTNVLTLLAARALNVPVVISERIDPRRHDIGTAWRALRRATYGRAAALIVQTERVRPWAITHVRGSRVHVIPNPQRVVQRAPGEAARRALRVVGMGRLVPQKGFDVLVRAFADLADDFPDWSLEIYGEGPERQALQALIDAHRLGSRATLCGRTNTADAVLAASAVFVLSSRYEGFPNVLLEAMTNGCACIAADCDSGPSELIDDRVSGRLIDVDDVAALSSALRELAGDASRRTSLGEQALAASRRYAPEHILDAWDTVLRQAQQTMERAA